MSKIGTITTSLLALTAALGIGAFGLASCQSVTMISAPVAEAGPGAYRFPYSLPRGFARLTVSRKANDDIKLTLPTRLMTADDRARLAITALPSALSDDQFILETDPSGLLKSVNGNHSDKSAQIVEKVVSIALDGARAAAGGNESANGGNGASPGFSFSILLDPFDEKSLTAAQETLSDVGLTLIVEGLDGEQLAPVSDSQARDAAGKCRQSLCMRLLRPVRFQISDKSGLQVHEELLVLPDPAAVFGIDVTRKACVDMATALTFSEGVLTKSDIKKPSELLGCLSIPANIVKSLLGYPVSLATQRKAQAAAESDLANSQVALIKAQQALLEAQLAATANKTANP